MRGDRAQHGDAAAPPHRWWVARTDPCPGVGTGYVWVDAPCPECGALVELLAVVRSVLTVPQDDPGTIRLRLKSKPVDHACRSGAQLAFDGVTITTTDDR